MSFQDGDHKILNVAVKRRIESIVGERKPHTWGLTVGWGRGVVDYVFRKVKVPGPRDLALLAIAEQIRSGQGGNRLLFNEGKGILETDLIAAPTHLLYSQIREPSEDYSRILLQDASADQEQEWTQRFRELRAEQRTALLLIMRGLVGEEEDILSG